MILKVVGNLGEILSCQSTSMIDAESHWSRVDDVSGEPVDRYGVDLPLVADKELVPTVSSPPSILFTFPKLRARE